MIKCKAENKIEEVKKLHSQGFGSRKISKQLDIPRSSLKYLCDKYGLLPQVKQIKNVNLTTYQKSMIIGTLLGDSSVSKRFCFNIGHSIKQKEYFKHKTKLLKDFNFLFYKRTYTDKRNNNQYTTLQAYSLVFEELKVYRKLFYIEDKKVITKDILDQFNEISLAYLFMDDGNSQKYNTTIALCSFDEYSINLFRSFLLEKWQIETTVTKQKSVRIRQKSILKFYNIIKEYIIPSMMYKIKFS